MEDNSDPPDLVASTGTNDPNGPWNGLLQTALQSGVSIGTSALSQALGTQTPVKGTGASSGAPTSAAAVVPTSNSSKYLLIGVTIAGIIAVIYIVMGGRK